MKRFKFGFLAVVALATMSFTVIDITRVFKPALLVADGCYTLSSQPTLPGRGASQCDAFSPTYPNVSTYATVTLIADTDGSNDGDETVENGILTTDLECPAPYEVICCFEVVNDEIRQVCYKED
jgi:hypothetical protein